MSGPFDSRCPDPMDVGDGDGLLPCGKCRACRLRVERQKPAWLAAQRALDEAAYRWCAGGEVTCDSLTGAARRFTAAENDARRRAKAAK